MKKDSKSESEILRRKAEELLNKKQQKPLSAFSEIGMLKLIHELEVHQLELELQNEELCRARTLAEEATSRYINLYEFAPSGYVTISTGSKISAINLTSAQMLGRDRSKIINQRFTDFISPDSGPVFNLFLKKIFQTRCKETCEVKLFVHGATPMYILLTGLITEDQEQCNVTMVDITQRKAAEEEQRIISDRYELVLQGAGGAIWDWDVANKRVYFSSRWKSLRGYTDHEVVTSETDWSNAIHPDDAPWVKAALEELFSGQEAIFEKEYRIQHKDGSWIWIRDRGKVLRDENGLVTRMAGSEIDITAQKKLDEVQVFLAHASGGKADEPFFDALARFLALSLDMDFVCIDRLEGDGLTATTLSVWCDGRFDDNVSYALKDTPCGEVVGKQVCCFPASVGKFFPRDQVLQDLRAESYIGVTLFDHTGQPTGLIAVISRKPLSNRPQAEAILKMAGLRAGAELERMDAEAALKASEEKFREMANLLPQVIFESDMNGILTYVNKIAFKIFGYPEDFPIKGFNSLDFYSPESRIRAVEKKKKKATGNQKATSNEYSMIRNDGSVFHALVYSNPIIKENVTNQC
jgi:PAS domain S-box-containing protein